MEVIIYSSPDDKKKNRGFCFLEYESHKAASLAKRRLGTGRIKVCTAGFAARWRAAGLPISQILDSLVPITLCCATMLCRQ